MKRRFFNLDLHISVIADVKHIINSIYNSTVEITNWSISGHNWVFGQGTTHVDIINGSTWRYINPNMITEFQTKYNDVLSRYDGFIVTHSPVFCLLYEKYNKPILVINSCRYDQPFCFSDSIPGWKWVSEGLQRMYNSGLLTVISNNKADKEYLYRGTGIHSVHIPSLCLYTNAIHNPLTNKAVVFGDKSLFPSSSLLDQKPHKYTWKDLYSYKAIVHTPYEISTMSLFEQYSAGVPLFLPSRNYFYDCIQNRKIPLNSIYFKNITSVTNQLPCLSEPLQNISFWLDRADYYDSDNFKYIYYYSSPEDLVEQLENFEDIHREKRLAWIEERKSTILNKWQSILKDFLRL